MQDEPYFDAIQNQMKTGGREAMLHDLLRDDLSAFNSRKFPATGALADQKIQSMSRIELWWLKTLQRGRLVDEYQHWGVEVFRDDVVDAYTAASRDGKATAQEVSLALRKLLPAGYPQKGSRPMVGGERKRTWVLPSLNECRDHFAALFKLGDCWPDDDA